MLVRYSGWGSSTKTYKMLSGRKMVSGYSIVGSSFYLSSEFPNKQNVQLKFSHCISLCSH